MHNAPQYLRALLPAKATRAQALALSLSSSQAACLEQGLLADAANYYYSGLLSFLDAVSGFERRVYTWSTVKLYYSVFYSLRSLLALAGHCIYYCNDKPFTCRSFVGSTSAACSGTTHKVVLTHFAKVFAGDPILSQDIAGQAPLDWLMGRREDANYKVGRFTDPSPPRHFFAVASQGNRRVINEYLADSSFLYTFDPDHAMIAFPLLALVRAREQLMRHNIVIDPSDRRFLQTLARDRSGAIPALMQLF